MIKGKLEEMESSSCRCSRPPLHPGKFMATRLEWCTIEALEGAFVWFLG
jgi:hypothetical protein